MFDWFWEFLYGISKVLMAGCDWIMDGARGLLGIDYVTIDGEQYDLLSYLLKSNYVTRGFGAVFSIAIIVAFILAVIAIIKSATKHEPGKNPIKIAFEALRNVLFFLAVPICMFTFTYFMNTFMKALYEATSQGSKSIGAFLFTMFAQDAGLTPEMEAHFLDMTIDYYETSVVAEIIQLKDFNYILCWIASGIVLFNLAASVGLFVERVISIILLYFAAPFAISATVLDDGARFKAWREQVLVKYLAAYGILIATNIYVMLCGLVTTSSVVFSSSETVNDITKLVIVDSGAYTMRKAHQLFANLVAGTPGSQVGDVTNSEGRGGLSNFFKSAGRTLGTGLKLILAATDEGKGGGSGGGGGGGSDNQIPAGAINPDQNNGEISPTGSQNVNTPVYDKDNDLKNALGEEVDTNQEKTDTNQNSQQVQTNNENNNQLANVIKNTSSTDNQAHIIEMNNEDLR